MGKDRKDKKGGGGGSSTTVSKDLIDIDPELIRFTHARIRPFFTGCGRRIEDTLSDIVENKISIHDLPHITVILNDGNYFSLNNRRLYVLKELRVKGLLENNTIKARLKVPLDREKEKYKLERCSLVAKIMKEKENTGTGTLIESKGVNDDDSNNEDDSNDDDEDDNNERDIDKNSNTNNDKSNNMKKVDDKKEENEKFDIVKDSTDEDENVPVKNSTTKKDNKKKDKKGKAEKEMSQNENKIDEITDELKKVKVGKKPRKKRDDDDDLL